jgi:membrane protein implicated in regulation of membrane protease activity
LGASIILWIIIGIAAVAVDVASSSFLFIWFALGSIMAIIAALLNISFVVQVIIFIVVSTILILVGYPIVKKTMKKTVQRTPTMEQSYIGREFTADEGIIDKATIKIDGIYWTLKNEGEPVKKGERIKVTGIEGNKLVIRKL